MPGRNSWQLNASEPLSINGNLGTLPEVATPGLLLFFQALEETHFLWVAMTHFQLSNRSF